MKISIFTDLEKVIAEVNRNVKLSDNFRLFELANNAGDPNQSMYLFSAKSNKHVEALQDFREILNRPVNVNSGYRQRDYNTQIGGDVNSAHLVGCAADIQLIKGLKQIDYIDAWFTALQAAGINQGAINVYSNYYHLESYSMDLMGYILPYTIRVYTSDSDYNALREHYKYRNYYFMRIKK